MKGSYEPGRRALADECCNGRLVLAQEGAVMRLVMRPICLHASLEAVLQRQAGLSDPLAYMQQDCDDLDDFIEQWRYRYTTVMDRR